MPGPNSDITSVDGSLDFSGGVNSIKVPTIQSTANPNGLLRSEVAWLNNFTVRDGGITTRAGWPFRGMIQDGSAIFQGGMVYEPNVGNPYLLIAIGGHIYKVDPDFATAPIDLTTDPTLQMPSTETHFYFLQAEEFAVIQAGDFKTLPLFWDDVTLRRSKGITNTGVAPGTPGVNEIPAAGAMTYYMNRIWYAQGRQYSAGDIVGGNSGTAAYNFRDSILNVTENPLVLGGDGFTVPIHAGNIRALFFNASIDAALGQGRLFIATRSAIFSLQVPITRADWIAATGANQPLQTVIQLVNGVVADRSVTPVSGDIFYQSLEPGIRSLMSTIRYAQQWGNISISANENRILQFTDRALMREASGIYFDNRLLQTALPKQLPQGVVHQALIPLDFIPISSFGAQTAPIWAGMYEGLDFLQLWTADFGGLQRAFAAVVSREESSIQLWELSQADRVDKVDNRITSIVEWPAFTKGEEFALKKLVSAELWIDRIWGEVVFTMEFRTDSDPCWKLWHKWKVCSARNSCEDVINPVCYPLTHYGEGYKATMTLPTPPTSCESFTGRPSNIGYQFQPRLTVKGFCRIRGIAKL